MNSEIKDELFLYKMACTELNNAEIKLEQSRSSNRKIFESALSAVTKASIIKNKSQKRLLEVVEDNYEV